MNLVQVVQISKMADASDDSQGRSSPNSGAGSDDARDAAADRQAAEMAQLQKQLEAATLQLRDRNGRLAAADADRVAMQVRVDAALHDKDRRLAEVSQAVDVARQREGCMAQELEQTQRLLQDAAKEKEVLGYMQSLQQTRVQHETATSPRAFQPVAQFGSTGAQGQVQPGAPADPVLNVINQWSQRSPGPRHADYWRASGQQQDRQSTSAPVNQQVNQQAARPSPAPSRPSQRGGQSHAVPMPRQMTYDGSTSWQSFILPFKSMVEACDWSVEEQLFRLCNSLRGDAAEYAFAQLSADVVGSVELLELALDARFAEKRTTASYLAQLESRKLKAQEKLTEYVADIKRLVIKGYPTADSQTRETIGLRYFVKGIPDRQVAIAVGMREPETMEEARSALDTYRSLQEEAVKPPRVRAVQSAGGANPKDDAFVTEKRLQKFGKELKSSFTNQFDELKSILGKGKKSDTKEQARNGGRRDQSPGRSPKGKRKVSFKDIECYKCHEMGHYARNCPESETETTDAEASDAGSTSESEEAAQSASESENC